MEVVFETLKWIAMGFSVVGNFYVNQKKVIGIYLWFIGSLFWVIFYSVYKFELCQLILFLIYTYLNIDGIIKWRKK